MARTPLMRQVVDAFSTGLREAGEVPARAAGTAGTTRRDLLKRAGVGAGALALGGALAPVAGAGRRDKGGSTWKDSARVVVVGAGLAGLSAAYRLKQHGVTASVLEGGTRIGGRANTARGLFDEGQYIEVGGELIDTSHTAIRSLARELGLELDDVLGAEPHGSRPVYWFGGSEYPEADAVADFMAMYPALKDDVAAAGYPTLHDSYTPAGRDLDLMSVRQWIDSRVPGGSASRLGRLLDAAYAIEYGAETSDQSALNLIYLLGYALPNRVQVFGGSDERFHVRGGTDMITQRLAAELAGQITTGVRLTSVRANGDGTVTLGTSAGPVTADHVVLAIPFTQLKGPVDISQAGFSALKRTAIDELGMGSNAKIQVQTRSRVWNEQGLNGETYTDAGWQNSWDTTRAQPGASGILEAYLGGDAASALLAKTPAAAAADFLAQVEPVIPGMTAAWNGKVSLGVSLRNPWTKGSYSYWKVGQYTKFAGVERERSGNIHFAGEHTSIDAQGYLEGAVETGQQAAGEILADLRAPA